MSRKCGGKKSLRSGALSHIMYLPLAGDDASHHHAQDETPTLTTGPGGEWLA